jgi:hypothetical protein
MKLQQIQMYPNTLKIHMVLHITYNKYIPSNTLLVILFIYLILFKKKKKKRVKPGHLQQIKKKIMGLSFSVKLHYIYLIIHWGEDQS